MLDKRELEEYKGVMIDKRTSHYKTSKIVIRDSFRVILVTAFIACLLPIARDYLKPSEPINPLISHSYGVSKAQASEPIREPQTIEEYIVYRFGKDSESALKIARCESQRDGKIQPDLIGDIHLMSINNGEMVGDSIGVFQIRTGGKGWNRAKANGMTADEFRVKLKDFKYNIDYAKNIYDKAGDWHDWYNCMVKVGL